MRLLREKISTNLAAKKLLTNALENDNFWNEYTLKCAVRNLTILQRFVTNKLNESEAQEVLSEAQKDEEEILRNLGIR